MTTQLDQHLTKAVASGAVPGVVALAADANGIIYSGAFGQRGPTDNTPMSQDTVFRIASMTKAVTAAAAMKLVEEGRIALDQAMKEVAPEIGQAQVLLGFDASGKPQTRAPKRDVTLRHLLTHTSGYSYDLFNAQVGNYMQYHQLPSITTCKFDSLKAPLVFDPGEAWQYGIGIDWAGRIVEIVTGQTLETYLEQHFFAPLAMGDTCFELRPDMQARLVQAASRTPDGGISPLEFEFPSDGDFHMGGGGLYSTGQDYLRFTRMILGQGSLDGILRGLFVANLPHHDDVRILTEKRLQGCSKCQSSPFIDINLVDPRQVDFRRVFSGGDVDARLIQHVQAGIERYSFT